MGTPRRVSYLGATGNQVKLPLWTVLSHLMMALTHEGNSLWSSGQGLFLL